MKKIGLLSFLLLSVSGFLCGMNQETVLVGWYGQNGSKTHYCEKVFVVSGTEVTELTSEQKNQAIPAWKVTPEKWRLWAVAKHAQSQS